MTRSSSKFTIDLVRCSLFFFIMLSVGPLRSLGSIGKRSFSQFQRVGVVGLGLMGHGVAQVTAAAGFQVLAIEAKPEALAVGMKRCCYFENLFTCL